MSACYLREERSTDLSILHCFTGPLKNNGGYFHMLLLSALMKSIHPDTGWTSDERSEVEGLKNTKHKRHTKAFHGKPFV